jgi:ABC-type polysaccharide/polyol phosphate export permease
MILEFKNFIKILKNYELWFYMARSKLRIRFLRTKLGPIWEIIGTLILLLCIAIIWSKLWNKDFLAFFPYLFLGFIIWKSIVSIVNDASMLFSETYKNMLENVYIHPFVLCTAIVCKNTFILLGFVACSIFIIIFTHKFFFLSIIFIIFYLLLFFITSISLTLIIATLCLRYRDLQHATNVILNLLFFFTPIIWSTDQLSEPNKRLLVDTNIIYHYVEFFRSSLFNGHPEIISFLVVIISTTVLFLLALYTSSKFSKKLVFWLL